MKSLILLLTMSLNMFAINIGEIPKEISLKGENGGLAKDSSVWSSSSLKGKVTVLVYVDPDEKDVNSEFIQVLDSKEYNNTLVGRVAIVNLAATWKPDYIIEKLLALQEKKVPTTIYVKDKKSVLVKEWGLADDASNILIFSKKGKLLFFKSEKLNTDEVEEAIEIIEANLEKNSH